MTYRFRLCFRTSEGAFSSNEEFLEFAAGASKIPLKFCAGYTGKKIGDSSRLVLSGGPFDTAEAATEAAQAVQTALLRYAAKNRLSLDWGERSLKAFGISNDFKKELSQIHNAPILEDHLGITIYVAEPKPKFQGIHATGRVSRQAAAFIDALSGDIGKGGFSSEKAELAAILYGMSHFEVSTPARFLAMITAIECLIEQMRQASSIQDHIDILIEVTRKSALPEAERDMMANRLSSLKMQSIGEAGRELIGSHLGSRTYGGMSAVDFFKKIYKIRSGLTHSGKLDPGEMANVIGDLTTFVSDLLQCHFVGEGSGFQQVVAS